MRFVTNVKLQSKTEICRGQGNEQEVHIGWTMIALTMKILLQSRETSLRGIIILRQKQTMRWKKIVITRYTISSLLLIKQTSIVHFCSKSGKWVAIIQQIAASAILSFATSNVWTITFLILFLFVLFWITRYTKKIGESKNIESIKAKFFCDYFRKTCLYIR